jgi:hypothetical protein
MLGDLYQQDTDGALATMAAAPPAPPKREERSAWGALARGPAAAAAELFSQAESALQVRGEPSRRAPDDPIRIERERALQGRAARAKSADEYARSLRPDPATASTAENVVFGVARGLSKAAGAVIAVGPAAGAAVFGGSEAAVQYDDLRRQNVDKDTALKAAGVAGVINAGSVLLPLSGPTLKATAALYLAGGPGGFMAQQAATRAILERADYAEIGKQFDPLDPLGLALSALIPLPFAGVGAVRNMRAAKGVAKPAPAAPAPAMPEAATDAAMAHNLTLQADQHAAMPVAAVVDELAARDVPSAAVPGRGAVVVTERGLQAPVRFRVVDAGDLITSHTDALDANPAFPAELQPRDRSRTASADQIARIENAIRPELLGDSVKASDGAPIIGPDAVVESGNARMIALRRAYDQGKAETYRAWLGENAARFGLDPQEVAGMRRPVLVRERLGEIDRAEFARQANESTVAAMSTVEQAKADAARLNDLSGLDANEDGTINMTRSAAFVRAFMQQAVSPTDRGTMLQADGRLSQTGQQRLRNAIFAKAYGDSGMVAALAESTDSNVRNVLAGLLRAAPEVARLRDLIESGARQPVDVAGDLVKAVQQFSKLRSDGMSVDQFLAQGSLIDGAIPPALNNLLIGIGENARAPKRMAEMVRQMVQAVDALGDPRQAGMFEDAPASQADVTANVVERLRSITDEQLTDTPSDAVSRSTDPLMRSIADRIEAVEMTRPDMVVGVDAEGKPVTVADELARVRREAAEGTDAELGALDADLVKVAADCALSMGAA